MISVIVPVYKVEKYLDKCVQSILAQTYKDFELILVDDGSPDNCPQMCDEYAKQDKRVRVIHKKNGGLSDARNYGTANAIGKYITYIDSDDYVTNDYLETLMSLIIKYDADMAVIGIEVFYEGETPKQRDQSKEYVYSGEKALEKMLYQDTLDTSACAILLPIELAKKYPFPLGKYHEDEFTTYKYYAEVDSVAVTTKKGYFYLQRKGSIMHVVGKSSLDELDAADNLVNYCKKEFPNLVSAAESKKFSDYCQIVLNNNFETNDVVFDRIYDYLKKISYRIVFDRKARIKNRVAAFVLLFGYKPLLALDKIVNRERMKNDIT